MARHLSYSRASRELCLTQPAVSMHIKQLETNLGVLLFERVRRKVYLTDAGKQLYAYSQRIFTLLDETVQVLLEIRGVIRGNLRVAADTTAGVYVVPRFLGMFHRAHPEVNIWLDVTNRTSATEKLLMNEVDLAVIGQVPDDHELIAEPFLPNELVVVSSAGHRLAGRQSVPLAELAQEGFLMREPGSGTRATAERFFASRGHPVQVTMELSSNSAIKQAVANDLGIAVISGHAVSLEVATGRLAILDVEGFPLVRHWHLVHPREKRLSPTAAAFKALLLDRTRDGEQAVAGS